MAIVPDQSPTSTPETDFGANDWLLEEMYEQYTADPDSVDATWVEYFKSHGAPTSGDGDGAGAEQEEPQGKRAAEPDATRREPTPTTCFTISTRRVNTTHLQCSRSSKRH